MPGAAIVTTDSMHRLPSSLVQRFAKAGMGGEKLASLLDVVTPLKNLPTIIFCHSASSCRAVLHCLRESGLDASGYFGDEHAKVRAAGMASFIAGGAGGAMAFTTTGSALGDPMRAHGRDVLSVAYRPVAPFAVASAAMDFQSIMWKGPPFVQELTATDHSNFVNCARFSPDGARYITVSSDKKGVFYDGLTGAKSGELAAPVKNAHTSSIYGVAWSPDSAQLLTAASDKTLKVWDAEGAFVKTIGIGAKKKKDRQIQHQQLACAWGATGPVSLGLNGDLTVVDPADWSVKATLVGHQVRRFFISFVCFDSFISSHLCCSILLFPSHTTRLRSPHSASTARTARASPGRTVTSFAGTQTKRRRALWGRWTRRTRRRCTRARSRAPASSATLCSPEGTTMSSARTAR